MGTFMGLSKNAEKILGLVKRIGNGLFCNEGLKTWAKKYMVMKDYTHNLQESCLLSKKEEERCLSMPRASVVKLVIA